MVKRNVLQKLVQDLTEYEKGLLSMEWKSNPIPEGIPFQEVIYRCAQKNPGSYGSRISKTVLYLTRDYTEKTSPKMDMGDGIINFFDILEIKTSFESVGVNGKRTYRIAHVRTYQDIKYYLFVFISRDTLTPRFYLLPACVVNKLKLTPMNGTAAANRENKNYSRSTTIKSEDVYRVIGSQSVLRGTKFEDYVQYLHNSCKKNHPKSKVISQLDNLEKVRKLGMKNPVYFNKQKVIKK